MRRVGVNADLSGIRIARDRIEESIVVDVSEAKALEARLVGIDRTALPGRVGLRAKDAYEQ